MDMETTSRTETLKQKIEGGKYLTFVLGHEEYGLEILKVREIMGVVEITSVPQMPHDVKGVINLRGTVIPIVDLRLKFGLAPREYDKETCIIVVNVAHALMGIVVDTVSEVLDIAGKDIDEPPQFGGTVDTSFIRGIGKVKGKVKILLDVEKVLTADLAMIPDMVHEATAAAA
ncbi:MAG: purine-binding chemotaxis protein CheW [Nitrospinae bacterium]|nr:purine-binding chemotaxis protein CheW [Nitrospinota bacterium]